MSNTALTLKNNTKTLGVIFDNGLTGSNIYNILQMKYRVYVVFCHMKQTYSGSPKIDLSLTNASSYHVL